MFRGAFVISLKFIGKKNNSRCVAGGGVRKSNRPRARYLRGWQEREEHTRRYMEDVMLLLLLLPPRDLIINLQIHLVSGCSILSVPLMIAAPSLALPSRPA
ncbi:hypothetical protein E2C01_076860 [Portunus trituberculatus]|uniref:Uncharacterized protein n=1 Tax=Portunus trituberculatus TaxID=210409 RepID=A0A5B7I9U8_PORTR|nr:hypothetical protein [Portunus trituberculatus]